MRRGRVTSTRGTNRTPAKGTKLRELVIRLLSPQGITLQEAGGAGASGRFDNLRNYGGWDIRGFLVPCDTGSNHRVVTAYRIVGRHLDNGRYRSLIQGIAREQK